MPLICLRKFLSLISSPKCVSWPSGKWKSCLGVVTITCHHVGPKFYLGKFCMINLLKDRAKTVKSTQKKGNIYMKIKGRKNVTFCPGKSKCFNGCLLCSNWFILGEMREISHVNADDLWIVFSVSPNFLPGKMLFFAKSFASKISPAKIWLSRGVYRSGFFHLEIVNLFL